MTSPIPIAVIGMGCRLPGGANNPEKLWDMIAEGRSGWSEVPADRWNWKSFYHPNPEAKEAINSKSGYFLDQDVAAFDARFFNIPVWEAHGMDPQQRILLETTYEALENAGIPLQSLKGSDTSVYVGMYARDYDRMGYKDLPQITKVHVTGSGEAIVSNRISYLFDLKGASLTIDTGCSGSMVALHQACQALRLGETSMAIVGGTQLLLHPDQTIPMSMVGMVNPNGRCFVFDSRGSGYARGEGVGTIVLKRLDDALAAGDPIHAVIRNSALNQDGKTAGISLPNSDAQAALMKLVYSSAGLDPRDTSYVEAHGTGTQAGDNAEISSISQVFCGPDRNDDIYVGSIKSNIGHLEASSGVAGLIKSIMILKKGLIPPNVDFVKPKESLKLDERKIKIPVSLIPLPLSERAGPRRVSLNSFGYGGTNAHVILESAPLSTKLPKAPVSGKRNGFLKVEEPISHGRKLQNDALPVDGFSSASSTASNEFSTNGTSPISETSSINGAEIPIKHDLTDSGTSPTNGTTKNSTKEEPSPKLIVVTANSEESLRTSIKSLHQWTTSCDPRKFSIEDLSYTLAMRRSMLPWRHTVVATTQEELASSLSLERPRISRISPNVRVAFVFTGQGAQWHAMGRELMLAPTRFRESLLKSDRILKGIGCEWSLEEELLKEDPTSRVGESEISQPSTTAVQIALVDMLATLGINPQSVVGHSSGEIAAAYSAGALSHDGAIEAAYQRGLWSAAAKILNTTKGAMLAVGIGEKEVLPYVKQTKNGVITVACVNSPDSTTISGDEAAIDELKDLLDEKAIFNRKLKVDSAYHSHHMKKVADQYQHSLEHITTTDTRSDVHFFSSVTGAKKTKDFGPSYWTRNLVSKVRFSDGVKLLSAEMTASKRSGTSADLFIEIGPHAALSGPLRQSLASSNLKYSYVSALVRNQNAIQTVSELAGQLFETGYPVDLKATIALTGSNHQPKTLGDLNPYSWDHSATFWHESRLSREHRLRDFPHHDLLGLFDVHSNVHEPRWRYHINVDHLPWLKDHVIEGSIIFPGSGYLCMALEAMKQITQIRKTAGKITKYTVRDISFSKPIIVPEPSMDGFTPEMEVQLTLSPSKGTDNSRWESFRIFSFSTEGVWNEHCSGRITVDMTSKTDEVEGTREQEFLKDAFLGQMELIQSACDTPITGEKFYEDMKTSGNDFGPTFAALTDINVGHCKGFTKLTIPDIAACMPSSFLEPHVIHPTTLDALNQLIAGLFKIHCSNSPLMPVYMGEITVSANMTTDAGQQLLVAVDVHPEGPKSLTGNCWAFQRNEDNSLSPVFTTSDLQLRGIGESQADDQDVPFQRKMTYKIEWEDDTKIMARETLEEVATSTAVLDVHTPPISSAEIPSGASETKILSRPKVVFLLGSESNSLHQLRDDLSTILIQGSSQCSQASWDNLEIEADTIYIVLDDLEIPILFEPSSQRFGILKTLFMASRSLLWISAQANFSTSASPFKGLVTGLARVVRRENEGMNFITFDIQDSLSSSSPEVPKILSEVAAASFWPSADTQTLNEYEYSYSNGKLLVPRIQTDERFNNWVDRAVRDLEPEMTLYQQSERPLKLHVETPGLLSSLRFVDDPQAEGPLLPDEIEIEARAYGINFKDVFIALGQMLPGVNMVGEIAGIVTAVGSNFQSRFQIGDRVAAIGARPFASRARINGFQACALPISMPFTIGASIPTVFLTAYQCIVEVARLRKGQTILIHAASGGVGQAAIMLAQNIGAEIFATVGSVSKRQLLIEKYNIPETHIFSTRSRTFKQGVLRLTTNKGVDVVLNSLSGEWLSDSWECIARLGTFVEIGKADIYHRSQLSMLPFDRSVTFAAVDLVVLFEVRPEEMSERFSKIMSMFEDKILSTLKPVTVMPMTDIEDAFRLISSRKHTGKVVLEVNDTTLVKAVPLRPAPLKLDGSGTYIVAGGLGDLGKRICLLLAAHGAKDIVTLGRGTLDPDVREGFVTEMRDLGAVVHLLKCDVVDEPQMKEAASFCQENLPPVKGIIHAGMVLRDHPLEQMTVDDYLTGLRPKVQGTVNLNATFGGSSLEFLITLSSISAILGKTGQMNYSAANAFQDAFAHAHAGKSNTRYISLNLGAIDGSEAITSLPTRQRELMRQGAILMKFEELFKALEYSMGPDAQRDGCVQSVFGFDRQSMETVQDSLALNNAMFSQLPESTNKASGDGPGAKLNIEDAVRACGSVEEATQVIAKAITEKFSLFLNRSMEDLDPDQPPASFGLDSLVSIELKNWMVRTFKVTLQTAEVGDASSIIALARSIASRSRLVSEELQAPVEDEIVEEIENISSQDAVEGTHGFKCCRYAKKFPKYPLMDFDDTFELLIDDIRPFASAEELVEVNKDIEKFKASSGPGRQAYQKLVDRANDPEIDNWLFDLQVGGVWLRRRFPLAPFQSFLATHHDSKIPHQQAERAALIARTAFKFKQAVESDSLEPHWYFGVPSCMDTWQWLFNASREPGKGIDKMRKFPGNDYCVVLRRGHVFKVMLKEGEENVSYSKLKAHFEAILDAVNDAGSWAGILTSDDRDSWAEIREKIQSQSEANAEYLKVIDAAAFLICLDDGSPANGPERVRQYLLGDGFNRWNDKCVQFMVCANGVSANLVEHTMIDGLTIHEMNGMIREAIDSHEPDSSMANGVTNELNGHSGGEVVLDEYILTTTPDVTNHMDVLRDRYIGYTSKREYLDFTLSYFGTKVLADHACPIKATFDLTIQLASRLYFGYNPASWEPVSTALYHKGRFAIVQVTTDSVLQFCASAFDTSISIFERRNMLLQAAQDYNARIRNCYNGNAYFRLMNAIRSVWPENEPLAPLFTNPTWLKTHPRFIMSNMTDGGSLDSAYVMGEAQSIWVSYSVEDTEARFCVVGPSGECHKFEGLLHKAAKIVKTLVESK